MRIIESPSISQGIGKRRKFISTRGYNLAMILTRYE